MNNYCTYWLTLAFPVLAKQSVWTKRDVGLASDHVNNCCNTRHTPLMACGYVREWDGYGKVLKLLQSLTQSALQGCAVLGQNCSSNIIFGTMKFSSGERLLLLQCSSSHTIRYGSERVNINNGNYMTEELLCSVSSSKQ